MRNIPQTVPIENKVALTIPEAAEYSNIGQNKLSDLLKNPRCPFVLYVGTKYSRNYREDKGCSVRALEGRA